MEIKIQTTSALQTLLQRNLPIVPTAAIPQEHHQVIDQWKKLTGPYSEALSFETLHNATSAILPKNEMNVLDYSLYLYSLELTNNRLQFDPTRREHTYAAVQALAGMLLMNALVIDADSDLQTTLLNTSVKLWGLETATLHEVESEIAKNSQTAKLKRTTTPDPRVQQHFRSLLNELQKLAEANPKIALVRKMADLYKQVQRFCLENNLPSHLYNFSIGDVTPETLPSDVREKMGLDSSGPKAISISARSLAHLQIAQRTGRDSFGYDIEAMGRRDLRLRYMEYATYYSLYSNSETIFESMIAAGGSQGLNKALLVARRWWESSNDSNKGKSCPIVFPNPGLRMLATNAMELGFNVLEPEGFQENGFFPSLESLDLEKFIHIQGKPAAFIYTPMGNPNGTIDSPENAKALLAFLEKYNIVLINDLAYLGTGDQEKTKQLCKVLSTYKLRIDVIPMTKIFAQPGLRSSCLLTPIKSLADHFSPVAQNYQPTESRAMQAEALAIWDHVLPEDRLSLTKLFKDRQERLVKRLQKMHQERLDAGMSPLLDLTKPLLGDAALYVLVPLAPGMNAFKFIEETGLIATPAGGFFKSGRKDYVRLSVGIEEIDF